MAADVEPASAAWVTKRSRGGGEAEVGAGGSDATTLELRPDDVGDASPLDVEFTTTDDSTATIRDSIDGRPMVVNFFASWCPPCISEMPDFEAVSQTVAGGVDFLGLAVQDRPEDAERIVEQTGVTYDWARDVRGDVAGAAGVVQMPTRLFVSADGEIVHAQPGAVSQSKLRELIEEHLGVTA